MTSKRERDLESPAEERNREKRRKVSQRGLDVGQDPGRVILGNLKRRQDVRGHAGSLGRPLGEVDQCRTGSPS